LSSLLFIALNLTDTWLTKQAFAIGEGELNQIVSYLGYADDLVLKGLLASVIALLLWRFGKSHLLWYLNIAMLPVVFWNSAVLTLSQMYCQAGLS